MLLGIRECFEVGPKSSQVDCLHTKLDANHLLRVGTDVESFSNQDDPLHEVRPEVGFRYMPYASLHSCTEVAMKKVEALLWRAVQWSSTPSSSATV